MDCGTTRRVLWPDGGPYAVTPEIEAARAHLDGCGSCQLFVRDTQALAEQIRAGAPHRPAPPELRERVFAAVGRARAASGERAPSSRRWRARLGIGIGVAAAVGAYLLSGSLLRPTAGTDKLAALADDHMRAVGIAAIASSDTAVVAQWLRARLPFGVHVPVFPGAELRGARLCQMEGRPGAAIEYRIDGGALSYYVLREADGPRGTRRGEAALQTATRAGYHIASWREPGLLHALVADLPARRLVSLAQYCMRQMATVVREPGEAGGGYRPLNVQVRLSSVR